MKEYTISEAVEILNDLQRQKYCKITNYENLTISLRKKLEDNIQVDLDDWIKDWSQLWWGKKSNGYYLAQPTKNNADRMRKFIQETGFSKEVIFQATEKYLKEKEAVNYEFAKKSNKFIEDTEGSVLFGFCQAIVSGEVEHKDFSVNDI